MFGAGLLGSAVGLVSVAGMPGSAPSGGASAGVEESVTYSGCNEVRALGRAPLYAGQPGYREDMDGDGDGIACEPHH